MRYSTIFGIDSHSRTTTICALTPDSGESLVRTFRGNDYEAMRRWMSCFQAPALGVYEAGCTGFFPARELTRGEVRVVPIAPSRMPTSSDSRTKKNDRNDATRLARLAAAGELKEVWVPDEATEGLRDLGHALDDLKGQRARAQQRVLALLLRHGIVWDRRTPRGRLKKKWGREFWDWLRAIDLGDPGSQAALQAAIRAADSATQQYDELLRQALEVVESSPAAAMVRALECLKCVSFLTALAFVAEVGDFTRFKSGRAITSYLGLAPSESSSGLSQRIGAITRCGPSILRTLLVEAAWSAARASATRDKACPASVDPQVREHASTLSRRLAQHRRSMLKRGLAPCKANAATAAELGRFMLFVGLDQLDAERRAG